MFAATVFLCLFGTPDACTQALAMHDERGPYATIEECQERTAQMQIDAFALAVSQGICRPRIWARCEQVEIGEVL